MMIMVQGQHTFKSGDFLALGQISLGDYATGLGVWPSLSCRVIPLPAFHKVAMMRTVTGALRWMALR